eukprot:scaffold30_cov416-Prasinococcus_capsulatus_cf.AAC.39
MTRLDEALVRLSEQQAWNGGIALDDVCLFFRRVARDAGLHRSCEVEPFGSLVSGLALRTSSDIDLNIRLGGGVADDRREVLSRIAAWISTHPTLEISNVEAVLHARVPVLRCYHLRFGCHCDIVVNNDEGVRNSRMLRFFVNRQPTFLHLARVLKAWALARGICGASQERLSSYALVLLLLSFLLSQKDPIVPPLDAFLASEEHTEFGTVPSNHSSQRNDQLAILFRGFIEQHAPNGKNHTAKSCVWTLTHGRVERTQWATSREGRSSNRVSSAPSFRVCIQDPFEEDWDPASTVTARGAQHIDAEFNRAHALMNQACVGDRDLECDWAFILGKLCESPVKEIEETMSHKRQTIDKAVNLVMRESKKRKHEPAMRTGIAARQSKMLDSLMDVNHGDSSEESRDECIVQES